MNASAQATRLRTALLTAATIIALLVLKVSAASLYATAWGRYPGAIIEVMSSRSLLFFWSPAGYYEQLLGGDRAKQKEIYESNNIVPDAYRIRRLRANLSNLTDWNVTGTPVNRFGYIGTDWSLAKPANTRRIAILGDSVTEGVAVRMDQRYVNLLQDRLNATEESQGSVQRFEFLDLSVWGYQLTQMMDVADRDVPQFHPDVYIVALTELSVYRGWDMHVGYLIKSRIDPQYEFLRQIAQSADASPTDRNEVLSAKLAPYRMEVIRESLLHIKADAEREGAQFIVILLPPVEDGDIAVRRFAGIHELLSSMNVSFVDVSDTFLPTLDRSSLRVNQTDVHPNAEGHKRICETLYDRLRTNPDAWSKLTGSAYAGSGADSQQKAVHQPQ